MTATFWLAAIYNSWAVLSDCSFEALYLGLYYL